MLEIKLLELSTVEFERITWTDHLSLCLQNVTPVSKPRGLMEHGAECNIPLGKPDQDSCRD